MLKYKIICHRVKKKISTNQIKNVRIYQEKKVMQPVRSSFGDAKKTKKSYLRSFIRLLFSLEPKLCFQTLKWVIALQDSYRKFFMVTQNRKILNQQIGYISTRVKLKM